MSIEATFSGKATPIAQRLGDVAQHYNPSTTMNSLGRIAPSLREALS